MCVERGKEASNKKVEKGMKLWEKAWKKNKKKENGGKVRGKRAPVIKTNRAAKRP